MPDDWFVVICDIRGSTKAIEEGRYQDVNTIGAASIAAVQSVWKAKEIPFVFGGDGASLLVPPSMIDVVRDSLLKLKAFSTSRYGMELRLGCVPVGEVSNQNLLIEAAKFAIAKKKTIALLRGGGLTWAESQIKSKPEKYCWSISDASTLEELKGLSCRWQPLNSQKGAIVSLLIKPRNEGSAAFTEILKGLTEIIDGGLLSANPVSRASMKYKTLGQTVATEVKYSLKVLSGAFIKRAIEIFISIWAFRLGLPVPFDVEKYVAQIPGHSDYRKFDDMLRMVLDCTEKQIEEITAYLDALQARGLIHYGLHRSSHALMTCLVESLDEGGHIHFIDGGDGGYAMAAKQLKERMSAS